MSEGRTSGPAFCHGVAACNALFRIETPAARWRRRGARSPAATWRQPNGSAPRCSPPRRTMASAWALLTETALQRGRPDAAIVCAKRAVALPPEDPIAHILHAKCLFVSGEAGQALAAAEAASNIIGYAPRSARCAGRDLRPARAASAGGGIVPTRGRRTSRRAAVPVQSRRHRANDRDAGCGRNALRRRDRLDRHYGLAHYCAPTCASRPRIATTSSKWRR